jgi:TrmH family RNA methyltransferase
VGRRSARQEEGAFVVEGPVLVAEAARAGWDVVAQYVPVGVPPVPGVDAEVVELGPGVLERVASTETPRPVLAEVRRPDRTLADVRGRSPILVADRLSDPGNLGTILRSAEASGIASVVTTTGSVDPYSPKVVRASAGALFHVPVVADVTPAELAGLGLPLVGTSSHRGSRYDEADLARPLVLVVGSEAHGVSADVPVGEWVTIPHVGRAESLNVAMAATLLCFEAARQRSRS